MVWHRHGTELYKVTSIYVSHSGFNRGLLLTALYEGQCLDILERIHCSSILGWKWLCVELFCLRQQEIEHHSRLSKCNYAIWGVWNLCFWRIRQRHESIGETNEFGLRNTLSCYKPGPVEDCATHRPRTALLKTLCEADYFQKLPLQKCANQISSYWALNCDTNKLACYHSSLLVTGTSSMLWL